MFCVAIETCLLVCRSGDTVQVGTLVSCEFPEHLVSQCPVVSACTGPSSLQSLESTILMKENFQ